MSVIKRDGRIEPVNFEKIHRRITNLMNKDPKLTNVDHVQLTQKIIKILYPDITTIELDEEAARLAANMEPIHLDYGTLSVRISVSNLHKNTDPKFSQMIKKAYAENSISDYLYYICHKFSDIIDKEINPERDYRHTYIGLRTFERLYGLKDKNSKVIDRPSYMWMRVALALFKRDILNCQDYQTNYLERHSKQVRKEYFKVDKDRSEPGLERRTRHIDVSIDGIDWDSINNSLDTLYADTITPNFDRAFRLYHYMSQGLCTKATPILFNAGTRTETLISCYLKSLSHESVNGMYVDNVEIANLFKSAGGVGYQLHDLRAHGSLINSSNGRAEGIVPFARSLNCTSRHVKQGGRRNGSLALYLSIWHADVIDFLNLKRPQGEENARARDLFYALWIPDMFMEALCSNDWWYLMSPDECPGLSDVWGQKFKELYEHYVSEGRYRVKMKAQALWKIVQELRIESGSPYLLAKDACNAKSGQKNLGTIKLSNLCCEILLYSSPEETADCVLASVALNSFVKSNEAGKLEVDFDYLGEVVELQVDSLNMVIDNNNYVNKKTRISNERHRPIGIGVQGLADLFIKLRIPFDSLQARHINRQIFETMYYHALKRSMELAKIYGPYSSFKGSPASEGKLQFDLWGIDIKDYTLRPELDWEQLRADIVEFGLRNSTLIALMPTATTSIILGNSSCFEPLISNIYKKKTLAGEFTMINKFLVQDLMELDLWNNKTYEAIKSADGSIQHIKEIPDDIKVLYRTVWEMKQRTIVDLCVDRGPFVCQSQSMNLFFAEPNEDKMTQAAIYAWTKGLKTLCYYTRTQKASNAIKYTVSIKEESESEVEEEKKTEYVCTDDVCIMCQG